MKKNLWIISFILSFSLTVFAQNGKIQILETGEFHGDEVTAQTGEAWLGLFRRGNDFSLLPAVLSVSLVNDQIVDEPDEKTGKEVAVLGQENPVFLIKGIGFGQGQSIPTIFSGEQSINNNFDLNFDLNGKNYRLKAETEKPDPENPQFINETSKLVLTSGKTKQVLYDPEGICSDCIWSMLWAGDLDADGKPDFYLNLNNHYNGEIKRLFLSSFAEKGKLVKEVAAFTTVGC